MPPRMNLVGQKFNMLTVVKFYDIQNTKSRWLCKCDCGNEVIVYGNNLKNNNTISCGCYFKAHNQDFNYKHGGCKDRLYTIWASMKDRCTNPNSKGYRWYGEKGIKVCKDWMTDYQSFKVWAVGNGYKDGLTIDRINSNKNYEPSNCQWITLKENSDKSKRKYPGIAENIKTGEIVSFDSLSDFAKQKHFNAHSVQTSVKVNRNFKDWKFSLHIQTKP